MENYSQKFSFICLTITVTVTVVRAQGTCLRCTAAYKACCTTLIVQIGPTVRHQSTSLSVLPKRPLAAKGGTTTTGEKHGRQFCLRCTTSTEHFRDLLHGANLRHGTDGFTSPPKEVALRIFPPIKIRRLWPGLNPRTWVLKASALPLDHRSRLLDHYFTSSSSPPSPS